MKIIPLNKLSLDEATELWNQAFSDYMIPIHMSALALIDRMYQQHLSYELSLVAVSKDKPVGILLYGQESINGKQVGWIGGMGVHPEYRHEGVGRLLMNEIKTTAEKIKADWIVLEVIDGNQKAEDLYKKLGYQELSELTVLETTLSDKEASIEVELVPVQDWVKYQENESMQTPWQNRLNKGGKLFHITSKKRSIGYILLEEVKNEKGIQNITIRQLVIDANEAEFIPPVLQCLYETYGEIVCKGSNLDRYSAVTFNLKNNGFKEILNQKQLYLILR